MWTIELVPVAEQAESATIWLTQYVLDIPTNGNCSNDKAPFSPFEWIREAVEIGIPIPSPMNKIKFFAMFSFKLSNLCDCWWTKSSASVNWVNFPISSECLIVGKVIFTRRLSFVLSLEMIWHSVKCTNASTTKTNRFGILVYFFFFRDVIQQANIASQRPYLTRTELTIKSKAFRLIWGNRSQSYSIRVFIFFCQNVRVVEHLWSKTTIGSCLCLDFTLISTIRIDIFHLKRYISVASSGCLPLLLFLSILSSFYFLSHRYNLSSLFSIEMDENVT